MPISPLYAGLEGDPLNSTGEQIASTVNSLISITEGVNEDLFFSKATLDLDFANNQHKVYEPFGLTRKSLTDVITTARNSTATYQSPNSITTAAINAPRITYNAATGDALGLLAEEQRTRLNTASASVTAPQNATVAAATHTISFYGTGSVALSGAHSATLVGTGSGRVTLTFTPTAGTLTMTPSGTVADLQLELGVAATSIIRGNEGSQVTRFADVISRALTTTNANAGSIFIEFDLLAAIPAGFSTSIVKIIDSANTLNRGFALRLAGSTFESVVRNDTVSASAAITVSDVMSSKKALVSFDNDAKKLLISIDGVSNEIAIASAVDMAAYMSHLFVAGATGISGTFAPHSKTVKRCTYFPRSFTAAEAQAITA